MRVTICPAPERGQQFTLTAETDADRELIDAIDMDGPHTLVRNLTHRAPNPKGAGYITTGVTLLADRKHPQALEAQTARHFFCTLRELGRLGLAQNTFHGHIGAGTCDSQTQDQFAAILEKLQLMLDIAARAIGKPERNVQSQAPAAAAAAIARRAKLGIVAAVGAGNYEAFRFFQGSLSAAQDMLSGLADRMVAKDAAASPDEIQAGLQAAIAALPEGTKNLSMAEVQQILATEGIKVSPNLVTDFNVGAGQILEHNVFAGAVDAHDEHAAARVDVSNGASKHCATPCSCKGDILAQRGSPA